MQVRTLRIKDSEWLEIQIRAAKRKEGMSEYIVRRVLEPEDRADRLLKEVKRLRDQVTVLQAGRD